MRNVNIAIEIYSIIISMIIAIYLHFKSSTKSKTDKWFCAMLISNSVMMLGDLSDWIFNGNKAEWVYWVFWIGMVLYYVSSAPLLYSFTGYIREYISQKTTVSSVFMRTTAVLALLQIILTLVSIPTGLYFSITTENTYVRGRGFLLSQLIPFAIYGIDLLLIIIYRKYLRRKEVFYFCFYIFMPVIGEVLQILFYGIATVNVLAAIAMVIIYINIQSEQALLLEKQEKQLAELQVNIMLSQIQPHFLYNSLTAIRQLCDIDSSQAKQCVTDFSRFLRANMDSLTSRNPIPFSQELLHVKSYLSLEKQRFGERLTVVYDIQTDEFELPPLTVQPIAENAVRHGIMKRDIGGVLNIRSSERDDYYELIVEDDGIGFDTSSSRVDDETTHIGITNVRNRVEELVNGTVDIESTPGKGTKVTIRIPKTDFKIRGMVMEVNKH